MILSGVRIGDGAVIGAGSMVTKEVAPYSIVGGVPARHIRYRFDEQARKLLQQIAWWDRPLEKLREAFPLLMSTDIQRFLDRYGTQDHHLEKQNH
jgi:carbonic anhydrase/acetyltransferase-like protein (isoleucine patch superfamily)